jgi:aconitate decarboxylase
VAALLDARLNLDSFSDARRFADDAKHLLSVTQLTQTAEISGRFDAMHVDVCVTLTDGTVVRHRCTAPLGSWSRPIAPEVIESKAHDLIDRRLSTQAAEKFWAAFDAPPRELRISTLMECLIADQPLD